MIKISDKQMLTESMERIDLLQRHIEAVESATSYLSRLRQTVPVGVDSLRQALIEEELKEWRNLFLWGLVVDQDTRDRVKAAAHDRFLRDEIDVGHWLNRGNSPGSWLVADEEKFRAMARKKFAPIDKGKGK